MRRELLLVGRMIEAAETACQLVAGVDVEDLTTTDSVAMHCSGTSSC